MALTNIEYGSVASSKVLNDNFNYLEDKIEEYNQKLNLNQASLTALINTQVASSIVQINENITAKLQTIYPVGSLYISVTETCPMIELFGQWEKVASGKVLQSANSEQTVGETVEAGLPNIKASARFGGSYSGGADVTASLKSGSGAIYVANTSTGATVAGAGGNYTVSTMGFDASRSNSIYGNSNTVQPPAFLVNIWRRVA